MSGEKGLLLQEARGKQVLLGLLCTRAGGSVTCCFLYGQRGMMWFCVREDVCACGTAQVAGYHVHGPGTSM